MKSHAFLCLLGAAGVLGAQTVATFPTDHATIPDGSANIYWFPFSNGVSRQMVVYESWELAAFAGRGITRIGFRQDGNTASAARAVQLEVRMAHTDRTAANLSSTFDSNYTLGAPATVFGPALLNLPQLTAQTTGQQVWVTLNTPFAYNGTDNLLVEFRVLANNNGNQSFTYYLDRGDFVSPNRAGQAGCQHSGNQTATLDSRATAIGSNWYLDLRNAPASSAAFCLIAPGATMPGAFSLQPFIPGIQPSCQGQIPLASIAVLTAVTNSSGGYTWTTAIPNNRLLYNDFVVTSQVAALDFFSPAGVVVSNADEIQFGIDPACTIVSSQGNVSAATGSVYRNYGVVTLFEYN